MRIIEVNSTDCIPHANPGTAPMLDWIPIEKLVVDDRYQRDLKRENWNAIRRIAKNFLWSRFSPVFVAPVEGGKFAIIDGQHRVHAAAMCGVEQVPCQIVQMTFEEQASSFAAVNGTVTKVTTWQVYKAALAAGLPWAVEATKVAENGGCRLMTSNASAKNKKPCEIYGVSEFRGILGVRPNASVSQALTALGKSETFGKSALPWQSGIFTPILLALTARPNSLDLSDPDLPTAIDNFELFDAVDDIQIKVNEKTRAGEACEPRRVLLEREFLDYLFVCYGDEVPLS